MQGSNPRPSVYKTAALPAELIRQRRAHRPCAAAHQPAWQARRPMARHCATGRRHGREDDDGRPDRHGCDCRARGPPRRRAGAGRAWPCELSRGRPARQGRARKPRPGDGGLRIAWPRAAAQAGDGQPRPGRPREDRLALRPADCARAHGSARHPRPGDAGNPHGGGRTCARWQALPGSRRAGGCAPRAGKGARAHLPGGAGQRGGLAQRGRHKRRRRDGAAGHGRTGSSLAGPPPARRGPACPGSPCRTRGRALPRPRPCRGAWAGNAQARARDRCGRRSQPADVRPAGGRQVNACSLPARNPSRAFHRGGPGGGAHRIRGWHAGAGPAAAAPPLSRTAPQRLHAGAGGGRRARGRAR